MAVTTPLDVTSLHERVKLRENLSVPAQREEGRDRHCERSEDERVPDAVQRETVHR